MRDSAEIWYEVVGTDPDGGISVTSTVYPTKESAENVAAGVNSYPRCRAYVRAKTFDQLNQTQKQYVIDSSASHFFMSDEPLASEVLLSNSTTGEEIRFTPEPSEIDRSLVRVEVRAESTNWNWKAVDLVPKAEARVLFSHMKQKYQNPPPIWIEP